MLVPPCLRARLFANVDGIRGDGRWTALQSLGSAVLNLSETRADCFNRLGVPLGTAGGISGVPPRLRVKNARCPVTSLLPCFEPRCPLFGMNLMAAIVSSVMLVCPVPSSGRETVIPPTVLQCIVSMVVLGSVHYGVFGLFA